MAVQMKTSVRSDFMISDAAMPQRMAELDKEQAAQFKQMLGERDSGGSASVMDDIRRAVNDLRDDEKFEQALKALDSELRSRISSAESGKDSDGVFRNKRTGEELPTDAHELAQMVVDGKLDVRDVPDELMTPELMQAIIALMIEMRFNKEPEKDNEPEEELFNPAVAAVNEQNYSREVSGQILAELYKIIEKHNEKQNDAEVTILDGISEPNDPDETLASIATGEIHAQEQANEGLFDEIIDNMVEQTEAVTSIDGTPAAMAQTDTAADGLQNAVSEAAAEGVEQLVQAADNSAQSNGAQTTQSDGGQTQSDSGQAQLEVRPISEAQTQKTAEVGTDADKNELDSVIESFTVKEANTSQTESTEDTITANVSNDPASRVQNASEEFEMLKNAKLGKKDGETDLNGAAGSIVNDRPIAFTRTDGTEIEVKPSEIIDQTAKLIERAIEQTKERSEYSLVLNPEELGRITVKLVKAADGAVSVTIAAENAHTQRVLEQHSELMQNNLRNSGVNLEEWQTVNESRQEAYAQDYNGSSKNPYFRRDDAQNTDDDNGDTTFADIIAAM